MQTFVLERPTTVKEAVDILTSCKHAPVMIKAGGTDLIPWMRKRLIKPAAVVDLSNIAELSKIESAERGGISILEIGAMASVNAVAAIAKKNFPAAEDACLSHSDQLIRNKATVVGNLCAAVPSADMIPALIVHDAVVHITGKDGERTVPVIEFVTGPRKTVLKPGEIVTKVVLQAPAGSRGCYLKLGRRNSLDLAQVGVAVSFAPGVQYRIACGAVAPKPVRAVEAEAMLKEAALNGAVLSGGAITNELLEKAACAAVSAVSPISDVRASCEYRLDQVGELVKRAVLIATEGKKV